MSIRKASFVVAFIVVSVAGCGRRGGLVDPSPIGDTVQLRDVNVDVPDGTVLEKDESAYVSFFFTSGLPDHEYICVLTALSKERDVVSHGFSSKTVKTVGEWKKGNPHNLRVRGGHTTREEIEFSYVHVVVFLGFGPEPWEARPPIMVNTLRNVLEHVVISRVITAPSPWTIIG